MTLELKGKNDVNLLAEVNSSQLSKMINWWNVSRFYGKIEIGMYLRLWLRCRGSDLAASYQGRVCRGTYPSSCHPSSRNPNFGRRLWQRARTAPSGLSVSCPTWTVPSMVYSWRENVPSSPRKCRYQIPL